MRRVLLSLLALPVVAACSSSSDGTSDGLTAAESQTVGNAIFASAFGSLHTGGALQGNRAALFQPITTYTTSCAQGGTVSAAVNFVNVVNGQGSGTDSASVALTDNSCAISTGTRTIVVSGSLNFGFTLTFTNAALTSFAANASGTFTWSGGSCAIAYNATATGGGHYSISGTVCDHSFSASY
jgi:hypothetical protein